MVTCASALGTRTAGTSNAAAMTRDLTPRIGEFSENCAIAGSNVGYRNGRGQLSLHFDQTIASRVVVSGRIARLFDLGNFNLSTAAGP